MLIKDIRLIPKKFITTPKGPILHIYKSSEKYIPEIGEIYCSEIKQNEIKGWKRHKQMQLNLTVIAGAVKFVIYDERAGSSSLGQFSEFILSRDYYHQLIVAPDLWIAFAGLDSCNLIINVASIEHDPVESELKDLASINYPWTAQ